MKDVARHALTRMPDVEMTKELKKESLSSKRQRREKRVLANSIEIILVSSVVMCPISVQEIGGSTLTVFSLF